MEHHRITKLLNNSTVSKFVTRNCIKVNYLSGGKYFVNKTGLKLRSYLSIQMLRSDWSDYSDTYFVVKGRLIVESTYNANLRNESTTFKNNTSSSSYISKKDLEFLMPMYSLLQYSDSYSMISGNCRVIIEMKRMMMREERGMLLIIV